MSPCACFKCKEDSILLPHMKNPAKLWLMHAKVFERESKTNNEHTVTILSKTCTIF